VAMARESLEPQSEAIAAPYVERNVVLDLLGVLIFKPIFGTSL